MLNVTFCAIFKHCDVIDEKNTLFSAIAKRAHYWIVSRNNLNCIAF